MLTDAPGGSPWRDLKNSENAVLDKLFFGSRLHEHNDPAQRVIGVGALPPDSAALVQLLRTDPSPDVRAAAASACHDAVALDAALRTESDAKVRAAIAGSLGKALATAPDEALVATVLAKPDCPDAVRAGIALHTQDEKRRRLAIDGIGDENLLVDIALAAEHAPVRLAAAERVHGEEPLRRLLNGARDKDRGVARMARERLDALQQIAQNARAADDIIGEAEALVAKPGPIVMAAVELDRRWKALALGDDAQRRARWEAIGLQMRQRFERELDEQRARAQFASRLHAWLASLATGPATTALPTMRDELNTLRSEATRLGDAAAQARLDQAEQQIAQWEQAAPALAAAEALVAEAEGLAADTSIDDAELPARWQALDAAARIPALTERFSAALFVIEQRRQAIVRASQQEQGAARQQLHTVLHEAEQALAAGQLVEARAAADAARGLKVHAGALPKPTVQRLSRVVQRLVELERWEKFGQQSARVQLCERAEALVQQALAPGLVAREVQQLRAEWKKLDEQHAGVPKPLWERFDGACTRAYAPAARHFAELSAQHKQARKQREEFIAAAALHAETLLGEPHNWGAIERWLRETDATWRGTTLGSVEHGAWKKLDDRLKAALAPLRGALSAARQQAKQEREALIAEAEALAAKAAERDAPSRVKELQARWQANSRSVVLPQRDERALWERFRGACNAVFDARAGSRKEADERKHVQRRNLEVLCEQLEQLGKAGDADEAQVERARRELQDQWRKAIADGGPAPAGIDARFKAARAGVEETLRGRARGTEAAVWQALFEKERLCEELDALVIAEGDVDPAAVESVQARWSALPPLSPEREQMMVARRDESLRAMTVEYGREDHGVKVRDCAAARRDALLELELMLGIDSPGDLQAERLAVQVKQLRDRFKRTPAGGGDSAVELLLKWCSLPGVAQPRDRQRCEKIVARLPRRR
jgi:DNA repair protein SbcC/Rad50